jgi:hypothetical protein
MFETIHIDIVMANSKCSAARRSDFEFLDVLPESRKAYTSVTTRRPAATLNIAHSPAPDFSFPLAITAPVSERPQRSALRPELEITAPVWGRLPT